MSVYSVNVYPSSTTIKTGNWYYGAYAIVNASSNCNTDVTWFSDKPSVATVNASSGYIYAKAPGTTRIYAQSTIDSSKKDYITVTVTSGTICVDSVTLNRSSISLEKGDTFTLSATICPTNATNKSISWRSSNTSVATVSGGVVTAKARGYAYIYAEAQDGSGEYDYCYVNVTEDILVTSVTVSPSSKTMNIGASAYLYETVCPTNATNKCVKWSSNKTSVATVNPDTGLVIAQGAGTATITATAQDGSGKKGYCTITVNPLVSVQSISLYPETMIMNIDDVNYLSATVLPANAADKRVRWCSSNPNVVCVDYYTGEITALAEGTASVTAYSVVDNTIGSKGCSITVLSQERTVRANGVIQENAAYIRSAANMFGLQPVDVAMVIYAEQCINVDWKDEVIDPMLAPTLNVSLGLGQMLISTARKVEDNGYLPITHYTEWHGNNSVENRDAGIAIKLLNAQENAKYVAGYLAYIIDLWEQEYPYISCDAGVLATLYNIGETGRNNAGPHSNPESNEFGRFASDHRQLLQCLL